jgi:hypothetical protein
METPKSIARCDPLRKGVLMPSILRLSDQQISELIALTKPLLPHYRDVFLRLSRSSSRAAPRSTTANVIAPRARSSGTIIFLRRHRTTTRVARDANVAPSQSAPALRIVRCWIKVPCFLSRGRTDDVFRRCISGHASVERESDPPSFDWQTLRLKPPDPQLSG